MFLTFWNMARKAATGQDNVWKRQMYKRLAWSFLGRKRTCYRLTCRTLERALRYSSSSGTERKRYLKEIVNTRVEAACWEHGVLYDEFLRTLDENGVELNRNMLQQLAIYEPRTFQSLCDFSVMKQTEAGFPTSTSQTPSGVITRGEPRQTNWK